MTDRRPVPAHRFARVVRLPAIAVGEPVDRSRLPGDSRSVAAVSDQGDGGGLQRSVGVLHPRLERVARRVEVERNRSGIEVGVDRAGRRPPADVTDPPSHRGASADRAGTAPPPPSSSDRTRAFGAVGADPDRLVRLFRQLLGRCTEFRVARPQQDGAAVLAYPKACAPDRSPRRGRPPARVVWWMQREFR